MVFQPIIKIVSLSQLIIGCKQTFMILRDIQLDKVYITKSDQTNDPVITKSLEKPPKLIKKNKFLNLQEDVHFCKKVRDHSIKILLIGNSGVGKSSILMRYSENKFLPNYYTTIGVDYKLKYMDINGKSVKLQIWDTAGQDRFKTIVSSYYRGAQGILIVYDVSDRSSFEGVTNWLNEIQKLADQSIVKYLVGNKNDLEERRQVQFQEGKKLSEKLKIGFKETSARLATNIDEIFVQMTETILGVRKFVAITDTQNQDQNQGNIHKLISDKKSEKKKQSSCC